MIYIKLINRIFYININIKIYIINGKMNYIPREIVSEILLYFRNYKDELHRKFKVGPRDIDMHLLIMRKYDNIRRKQINKKNQDGIIENMVEYYDKLYEKYGFGEGEHTVIINKIQEINLFLKEEYKNRDGKHYE